MKMTSRLWMTWQRVIAAVFALAAMATPLVALAQGDGGTGSGAGGPPPGGGPMNPPAGGGGGAEGGRSLAWIVVILAIAIAVYLFTRRRGRTAPR